MNDASFLHRDCDVFLVLVGVVSKLWDATPVVHVHQDEGGGHQMVEPYLEWRYQDKYNQLSWTTASNQVENLIKMHDC